MQQATVNPTYGPMVLSTNPTSFMDFNVELAKLRFRDGRLVSSVGDISQQKGPLLRATYIDIFALFLSQECRKNSLYIKGYLHEATD
jgi:hypothetical protein